MYNILSTLLHLLFHWTHSLYHFLRLFLITDSPPSTIPRQLASLCSVVLFHPQYFGLESRILDEFLYIQNHKTYSEKEQLKQVSTSLWVMNYMYYLSYFSWAVMHFPCYYSCKVFFGISFRISILKFYWLNH